MKKIVFGFLLVFLNFNLTFNGHSIDVLPDFVGYYLLLRGTRELEGESRLFAAPRPFMAGMMIYTAILWLGALLKVGGGVLGTVLGIIALVVRYYIAWVLVQALREMERNHDADLYGSVLLSRWKIMLGLNVAIQLLRLLAMAAPIDVLGMASVVLVLADIVWAFLFVLGWNRAAALWEEVRTGAAAATPAEEEAAPAEEPGEAPEEPSEPEE